MQYRYVDKYFVPFNGLFNYFVGQWSETSYHSPLTDEFGDKIEMGESYFMRKYDTRSVRLSKRSMDNLLKVMFLSNNWLEDICDNLNQIQKDHLDNELKKAVGSLSNSDS